MKNQYSRLFGSILIVGVFLFLAFGSDEEESNSDVSAKVSIDGKFENDNALKDYLISKGEMKFNCIRTGFSVRMKFLNHSKVEVVTIGNEMGGTSKFTTEYKIEDRFFWEVTPLGGDKKFRRSVTLKEGGVLGEEKAAVQFMCLSKDPTADTPSFEGERVWLEDGCNGLSL